MKLKEALMIASPNNWVVVEKDNKVIATGSNGRRLAMQIKSKEEKKLFLLDTVKQIKGTQDCITYII